MKKIPIFFSVFFGIVILILLSINARAAGEVDLMWQYKNGPLAGQVPSDGLIPGSEVLLTATFTGNPSDCNGPLGYKLYGVIAHAVGGNTRNIEYFNKDTPADTIVMTYDFNSGSSGQENLYWAIFYCWNTNSPETALGTAKVWQSYLFNQKTVQSAQTNQNNQNNAPQTATKSFSFNPPTGSKTISDLINGVLSWAIKIVIPIATLVIIFAGFTLLTSRGDPNRIKLGKSMLTWAIVGLAVILIGKGFITLIKSIINLAK